MDILILGGTGAMGSPLVEYLRNTEHSVTVTSRKENVSSDNIIYTKCNARDDDVLQALLKKHYDCIIDFMVYSTDDFKRKLSVFLDNTDQYFFFSSSRVYAEEKGELREDSLRLLDSCKDLEYLKSDEYALSKARSENILRESGQKNWTIIRPYITYYNERMQLGVYEKENWLYRALKGRTIVLPKDIAEKETSLTWGNDVSRNIVYLIGNAKALGETYHIVTPERHTWGEILKMYLDIIEKYTGMTPKVMFPDNSDSLQKVWNYAQIKYDRLYNRRFDNSKITRDCGELKYKTLQNGLEDCMKEFLKKPEWRSINWKYEGWADKYSNEWTPLSEIADSKLKMKYLFSRITAKK